MAEASAISWTKSTFNPWIGCTKVGPGCDNCYAAALDEARLSKTLGGGTKDKPIIHWGHGAPRYRTSVQNWNGPRKWNKLAPESSFAGYKGFWPVFCASLADVFDNEADGITRMELFDLIEQTPNLVWQIVTKRVGNALTMVPATWGSKGWPKNVCLIATVVNQEEFDRDWPKLRAAPVRWRGLSVEPMLGPIRFKPVDVYGKLHWVIYGGESSQGGAAARACDTEWIEDGLLQCRDLGIAPFVKQLGSNCMDVPPGKPAPWEKPGTKWKLALRDKAGADPKEWPERFRVQEFPL